MKKVLFIIAVLLCAKSFAQPEKLVVTKDITHFWNAYDQIILTKDSLRQISLINSLFIAKATPGLKAIMKVKRYTAAGYIYAINHYPKFWNSVRANTMKATEYSSAIEKGIKKLRQIYPALKPAKIYFTIGLLRTGGTTLDDMVLIGSEVAMTDKKAVTEEFDSTYSNLRKYFDTDPVNGNIVFLNVHEYVHTQQRLSAQYTLLAQTMVEGVAEFVATRALQITSPNPQIQFGKTIEARLKPEFIRDMFSSDFSRWLWNAPDNEFGMGDLGYFIGYIICEKYYSLAKDKRKAIKELIQLDYGNEQQLFEMVDRSGYFAEPLASMKARFEKQSPSEK